MRIFEGTVITCDGSGRVCGFLVEDKGKIVFVGDELPGKWQNRKRVSLGGGCLVPAFADTHIHFMSHALFSGGLDVRRAKTNGEIVTLVRSYAEKRKDKIVLGFGASAFGVAEGEMIRRDRLDEACPDRPVFLVKYDGHAAIANSALLKRLPAEIASQRGYDAASGLMTQEAFFRITDFVTATVSLPDTLSRMLRAADRMAEKGIAMVHSVSGVGFPGDMDVTLESLFAKGLRNKIAYRVFFQTMDVEKAVKRGLPRIGGCFATALDGCFGSVDAAMNESYEGTDDRGILYYSDERVVKFAKEANRAGLQIEMHAIGDRAFDQAVTAIAAALDDFPREDHRHTIIHSCLTTEASLEKCAKYGIASAVQPAFIHWDQEPLIFLEKIMGKRAYRLNPLATMARKGIILAGGSDGPCTEPDPLYAMWAACNHYVPEESLTVQEALNMFTRNAAWMSFDDAERGSLEAGKIADMAVLDKNLFAIPKADIKNVAVKGLYVGGKPYKSGQGRLSMLIRGLLSARKI